MRVVGERGAIAGRRTKHTVNSRLVRVAAAALLAAGTKLAEARKGLGDAVAVEEEVGCGRVSGSLSGRISMRVRSSAHFIVALTADKGYVHV